MDKSRNSVSYIQIFLLFLLLGLPLAISQKEQQETVPEIQQEALLPETSPEAQQGAPTPLDLFSSDVSSDVSSDESTMISPPFQAVSETLAPLIRKLSVIVGGLFGVYVILLVFRVYYERKVLKVLLDIRYDLDQLNKHYRIPASPDRKRLLRRAISFLFTPRASRKRKK